MSAQGNGNASAAIALSASGAVIAAPGAGKRIRVFGVCAVGRAATDIKFQSAATDLTGAIPLAANGGIVWPGSSQPYMVCAINEAFNINMTVSTTLGGVVLYDIV